MKKIWIIVSIFSLFLVGCSNSLVGTYEVKEIEELLDRKKYVEDWLQYSKFIMEDNKKIRVLSEDGMKYLKVSAPPAGSIMYLYQDYATSQRDGWFPYSSTEGETHFIHLLGTTCEWIDCQEMWSKADVVALRLKDKVKYVNIQGLSEPQAVIHRTTAYDYDKEQWVEKTEEIYLEDILDTAYAFMIYGEKREKEEYLVLSKKLLKTVLSLQKDVEKNQRKELSGSVYYRLTKYENESSYKPSWDSYPFSLGYEMEKTMTKAEELFKTGEYYQAKQKSQTWIGKNIKKDELFNEFGLPYVGLNGRGQFIRDLEYSWRAEQETKSVEIYKFIAIAKLWFPNDKSLEKIENLPTSTNVMSKWVMSEIIKENGQAKFSSDQVEIPKVYYLKYLHEKGNAEEVKSMLKDLMRNQRLKGDKISKGAWIEGSHTNIPHTFEIIETICSIYTPNVK